MTTNRRDFLSAVAATIAIPALSDGQPRGGLRVRKDVADLNVNSPDIVALNDAVQKMKAGTGMAPNDGRRWAAQAAIHGTAQDFTSCQHENWFFLPWHRAYLFFFEDIVRGLSGNDDFALPYWDWTNQRELPGLFWGLGNPLYDSNRRAAQAESIRESEYNRYVSQTIISRILGTDDFELFGGFQVGQVGEHARPGQLEATPHNFVHRWVGGDMVTGASPTDPIFWLHHCNIDRLWTEWVRKHPDGTPNAQAWLSAAMTPFVDRAGQAAQKVVRDVLDTANLGYRYDTRPQAIAAVPGRAPAAVSNAKPKTVFTGPGPDTGQVAEFRFVAGEAFSAAVNRIVDTPPIDRKQTVRLTLKGVPRPRNADVGIDVFLNCRKLSANTPISDPTYVGSCTFFGSAHPMRAGHGADAGISFAFDLTPELARLYGDRPLRENEPLNVGIVVRPLFGEGRPEIKELRPEQVLIETATPM